MFQRSKKPRTNKHSLSTGNVRALWILKRKYRLAYLRKYIVRVSRAKLHVLSNYGMAPVRIQ